MIPAKIEPILITTNREKGTDSIVDWFDQHIQSFYILGLTYLSNQQQMEELFFQSIIKVHKELPRYKSETTFKMWATSIFIQICRELSNDRSLQASSGKNKPRQDLFKALDRLEGNEKEAVVLTYLKGFSQEETAQILQVPVEKMKELLFTGLHSLRKEMGFGSSFNGCLEYRKDYMDYLERVIDRSKKIAFEIHIYHCQDCQEDLATFQEVMQMMLNFTNRLQDLHIPSGFIENVKERLAEKKKLRDGKIKKRKKVGLVVAGVFTLLMSIGFFTGVFSNLYYTWTEEDPQLRAFLQQDLGERLNLEADSNGVKIKIKSAIADEVQTLVFYEIEDTNEDNQYVMNYDDGVSVENTFEIMSYDSYPKYTIPDLESSINDEEKNVYHGRISLLPLTTDDGVIKLKVAKLYKLKRDASNPNDFVGYDDTGQETGEWAFEIPVTKQPSIEYAMDKETEIEGIPVRFDKLIVAPTTTILQFGLNNLQKGKRIDILNFDNLEVNNKKLKVDRYSNGYYSDSYQDINWTIFQTQFDSLLGEKPKEVKVKLQSMYLTIEDKKTIELDASGVYPQTFEYAGSTISIDTLEVGQPTKVVISDYEIENRSYESLHFNIMGEDENEFHSMEMNTDGVLVDKNGKEYDMNNYTGAYEEIERPRYFITVQSMLLQSDNVGEEVVPKKLELYGYNAMKYLDNVVKISLE
jgi:RNA polymerase sigma factor (sigma-70 family)